ncbi:unnamed protein product [Pleuronectes platessa]|uniref:Uncharacterized protein n=1 Tax=Pleuronectes platessa TaxID=8262 RepID=A0A9N7Z054_PLEPL|nr:unnamed protein product [Pleuronectes platessa]
MSLTWTDHSLHRGCQSGPRAGSLWFQSEPDSGGGNRLERAGGSKGMICAMDEFTPAPAETIGLADSKTKPEISSCPFHSVSTLHLHTPPELRTGTQKHTPHHGAPPPRSPPVL